MRTIRNTLLATFAVTSLLLGTPAFANHCPLDMKAIDDKLATKPNLSAEDAAKVAKLRADGEALHKSGKHAESVQTLGEAKKILGLP